MEGKLDRLYNMDLGTKIFFDNNSSWLRVPGGWVYGDMQGTTFVPFHNEFQRKVEESTDE